MFWIVCTARSVASATHANVDWYIGINDIFHLAAKGDTNKTSSNTDGGNVIAKGKGSVQSINISSSDSSEAEISDDNMEDDDSEGDHQSNNGDDHDNNDHSDDGDWLPEMPTLSRSAVPKNKPAADAEKAKGKSTAWATGKRASPCTPVKRRAACDMDTSDDDTPLVAAFVKYGVLSPRARLSINQGTDQSSPDAAGPSTPLSKRTRG